MNAPAWRRRLRHARAASTPRRSTLTIINTQTPGVECARRAGNPLAALVLTAAAGCATDGLLIAPMDGPAALMSLGAFKTPDEMIGHEARHAIQRWRHAPLLSVSDGVCG